MLYEELGFEVIDVTDTGLPATGDKTLTKLITKLIIEHDISEEELNE